MSENTYFLIRNWSEDDRPREKLLLKGKAALSDAELIAILIGSGSRNESAVDLGKRILNNFDDIERQVDECRLPRITPEFQVQCKSLDTQVPARHLAPSLERRVF